MTSQPDPKDGPPRVTAEMLEAANLEHHRQVYDFGCPGNVIRPSVLAAALRVVPPEGGPRQPTDTDRLDWLSSHSPCPDWKPLTSLHRGQIDALMRAESRPNE